MMSQRALARLAFGAAAFFLFTGVASAAACYEEQPGPDIMICNGGGGNSADFVQDCTYTAGPPVRVEVPCPGRWVNIVNSSDTPEVACARAGMVPAATERGDICASGERRPRVGNNYQGISYRYGTWGSGTGIGNVYQMINFQDNQQYSYCWSNGQKRDYDATDRTVAYYCK